MVCIEDHFTKVCLHLTKVQQYVKSQASQLKILTNPFPTQQQQMVATNLAPPQGGNAGHPQQGGGSCNSNVLMVGKMVGFTTRAPNYDTTEGNPPI